MLKAAGVTGFTFGVALLVGCNQILGIDGGVSEGSGGAASTASSSSGSGHTSSSATASSVSGSGAGGSGGAGGAASSSISSTTSSSSASATSVAASTSSTSSTSTSTGSSSSSSSSSSSGITYPAISVGVIRACAVESDGSVHCWGDNSESQLLITDPNVMLPKATLIPNVPPAVEVAVGQEHQLALLSNGDVWGWGVSTFGELGFVDMNPKGPAVIAGVTGAIAIAASDECSCALLSGGTVECWGATDAGCLGNASTASGTQPTPMTVPNVQKAVQIRLGSSTQPTCARLEDGTVWCWDSGIAPSQVPGVSDATNVAIGENFIFIESASQGVVWSKHDKGAWTTVTPYVTGVTNIAAGAAFVGLRSDGKVVLSRLQDETMPPAPAPIPGQPSGTVVEIEAGYGYSYGGDLECLRLAGPIPSSVYCWGDDGQGALGANAPEIFTTPTATGVTNATWLATAQQSSNAVVGGSVSFWGMSESVSPKTYATPTTLSLAGTSNTGFRTNDADDFAYALKSSGGPVLFYEGQSKSGLRLLASGFTDFTDLWEMQSFDVGLRAGGAIVVYALNGMSNGPGIFGNGTTTATANQIVTVPGITASAVAAYCDDYDPEPAHICAIVGGAVSCWGSNHSGEVAPGNNASVTTPTVVAIPGNPTIVSITAARDFTCAVTSGGAVWCWGDNGNGQLGNGGTMASNSPTQVMGVSNALGVSARYAHACAWLSTGGVTCWGADDVGQLGDGMFNTGTGMPVTPNESNVVQVSAGDSHTCARHTDGSVDCWGSSYYGQVGTGVSGEFTSPQAVLGL